MNEPLLFIDPLLNKKPNTVYPPPAPLTTMAPTSQKQASVPTRKKHPALSARILAVGLSTTALIGMTSGYTLAQKQSATQPIAQNPTNNANASTTASSNSSAQMAGTESKTSTQVVQVPVPSIASPATPGTAVPTYQPSQTQQQSSGSN